MLNYFCTAAINTTSSNFANWPTCHSLCTWRWKQTYHIPLTPLTLLFPTVLNAREDFPIFWAGIGLKKFHIIFFLLVDFIFIHSKSGCISNNIGYFLSEFTTMAGRRLRDAVKRVLTSGGRKEFDNNVHVVIAGLTNTYSQYVTTFEEYKVQRYEVWVTHPSSSIVFLTSLSYHLVNCPLSGIM